MKKILFDEGADDTSGGGGGSAATAGVNGDGGKKWWEGTQDDTAAFIQNKGWKGPDEAVKSYRELEGMVGANTVKVPGKNDPPEAWKGVFDKLGRPEKADSYKTPEFEFKSGIKIDEDKVKPFKELFHEEGILPKQAERILTKYFETEDSILQAKAEADEVAKAKAESELKQSLGDKYDSRMDIAKNVLNQVATPELVGFLDESGLGNNPHLINALVKLGQLTMEDQATGQGEGFTVNDSTAARLEIEQLNGDKEFTTKFLAGDKGAVAKMDRLFKIAYPKEKTT